MGPEKEDLAQLGAGRRKNNIVVNPNSGLEEDENAKRKDWKEGCQGNYPISKGLDLMGC